jgi:deoxyribose-phosphate aldolase
MNYTPEQIASVLDYAVLDPNVGNSKITEEADFCDQMNIKCFCCSSTHIEMATIYHSNVAAVIGFPHGNVHPKAKHAEAMQAIEDGATELDLVVNYGRANTGDYDIIKEELAPICEDAHIRGVTVKAILETCIMGPDQIRAASRECIESEVDYLKTSTGFGREGATFYTVRLLLEAVAGTRVKVKASGGIRCYADVVKYLDMGCQRIGASCYQELLP